MNEIRPREFVYPSDRGTKSRVFGTSPMTLTRKFPPGGGGRGGAVFRYPETMVATGSWDNTSRRFAFEL